MSDKKEKFNWRNHLKDIYLIGAIASFAIGALIAYFGNEAKNPFVIIFGFFGLAGGFMLFRAWRSFGKTHIVTKDGKVVSQASLVGELPNSFNIYEKLVEFAHVENPKGQPVRCLNDNQYYFLNIDSQNGEGLVELTLPDDDEKERYYDPQEFANPVTMPSNKKYFTWSASTMQKISIGIMAFIIAIELVALIAIP